MYFVARKKQKFGHTSSVLLQAWKGGKMSAATNSERGHEDDDSKCGDRVRERARRRGALHPQRGSSWELRLGE